MIIWAQGVVSALRDSWAGAIRLDVDLDPEDNLDPGGNLHPEDNLDVGHDDLAAPTPPRTTIPALAYPDLVGKPVVGDRVLLNTAAYQRGLGTGGFALVVAVPDRLPTSSPGPGHLVKARYTPLQSMVLGVDDQESPHHDVLHDADSLEGMPVVAADLHSSLPAVVAGVRARPGGENLRVAYVMTDGGALPAAFSASCAGLREAGWLASVITTGQSFGGDFEAVTVHTGLLAARHVVHADVAVVTQGPGNLGTGTRWGFSGVALGEALNATGVLHGRGIAALRISAADERPRHRGVSHHNDTAYGRVLMRPTDLVIPDLTGCEGVDPAFAGYVRTQAVELIDRAPHLRGVSIRCEHLRQALGASPVRLSTMGRGVDQDPAAFLAAAAAGWHAAALTSANA
ncbi:MAG: DUF3866 family protein [Ornithinimicrobium sp.]